MTGGDLLAYGYLAVLLLWPFALLWLATRLRDRSSNKDRDQ